MKASLDRAAVSWGPQAAESGSLSHPAGGLWRLAGLAGLAEVQLGPGDAGG